MIAAILAGGAVLVGVVIGSSTGDSTNGQPASSPPSPQTTVPLTVPQTTNSPLYYEPSWSDAVIKSWASSEPGLYEALGIDFDPKTEVEVRRLLATRAFVEMVARRVCENMSVYQRGVDAFEWDPILVNTTRVELTAGQTDRMITDLAFAYCPTDAGRD